MFRGPLPAAKGLNPQFVFGDEMIAWQTGTGLPADGSFSEGCRCVYHHTAEWLKAALQSGPEREKLSSCVRRKSA